MDSWDVIVVGAGAAGIAAVKSLVARGIERILLIDTRSRIGGRTYTVLDEKFINHPLELGAEFIHGDKAITHELLDELGMKTIPVVRMKNLWWKGIHRDEAEESHLITKVYNGLKVLEEIEFEAHEDPSLSDFLHQHCGITEEEKRMADVLLAQTCCADINQLSARDLQREMKVDHAGHEESRIGEGYSSLWSRYLNTSPSSSSSSSFSKQLVIQLNTTMRDIIKYPDDLYFTLKAKRRKDAEGGEEEKEEEELVFKSKACIITVPLSILQSSIQNSEANNDAFGLRFQPPLNQRIQKAIMSFKMEPATKLIYSFVCSKKLWDPSLTYLAHDGVVARWWTPSYGRETETGHSSSSSSSSSSSTSPQLITAYITSDRARHIDSLSEEEALLLGLSELALLLRLPLKDLQRWLKASKRVSWSADPCSRGGYAYLLAGKWKELGDDPRRVLAGEEGRGGLFFAGEATAYDTNPQTVHGAFETGWRTARECCDYLSCVFALWKSKL